MSTQNLEGVHELLVVRGYAGAGAVAGGAGGGAGGAGIGVVHDVVGRHAAAGADVDAAAGEVGAGGKADGAAIGEDDGLLGPGLAGGGLADESGPLELLQGRGADLGLAVGLGVNEQAHGHLDAHAVGFGDDLLAVFVLLYEELAVGKQIVQQLGHLGIETAGVAAQIEAQGHRALVQELFDAVDGVLGGAGLKVLDLHIARHGLLQTAEDRAAVDAGAVDLDFPPSLAEGQDELGVEAGANELSRLVEGLVGQVDVVHGGDHVARREPRPGGGRVHVDGDDLKAAVLLFQDSHSDAAVFIGGRELEGLVLVGRHVVAPLVAEGRDHGGGGIVAEGTAVDGVDVAIVHHVLDLDVAHGLVKLVLAAHGVEHGAVGLPPDGPAGQGQQEDHDFHADRDIQNSMDKAQYRV